MSDTTTTTTPTTTHKNQETTMTTTAATAIATAIDRSIAADEAAALALTTAAYVTHQNLPSTSLREVGRELKALGRSAAPNTVTMLDHVGRILSLPTDDDHRPLDIDTSDDNATAQEARRLVNAAARTAGQPAIRAALKHSTSREEALVRLSQVRPPADDDEATEEATPTTDQELLNSMRAIFHGFKNDGTVAEGTIETLKTILG